jgi:hypothetical protein
MYGIKFSQNTLLCPWLAEVNIDMRDIQTNH